MNEAAGKAIFAAIISAYLLGIFSAFFKDDYDGKDVAIALMFPPYPLYIAGKEIYYLSSVSSEKREQISKCRDSLQDAGMPPEMRVSICNCLKKNTQSECKQKWESMKSR